MLTRVFPPRTGGSGRWFWEIYRRLEKDRFLVAAGEHADQRAFDLGHDMRIERIPLELRSWGIAAPRSLVAYAGLTVRLWRLVGRERVDTIHAGCALPEGFLALLIHRLRGVRYLVYVHGEELNVVRASRELGWMTRRVFRRADYLIANSRNTAGILRNDWGLPEHRIRIVHPGVDIDRFVPAARDHSLRRGWGWENRRVVLTVGRLQKRKGHDQLIRALARIRREVPDVLYAIVGDGQERSVLEQLVARHGLQDVVQFRGEPDDTELIACYQQCDLFVLPNRRIEGDIEGFGMVLLEAQACGRPVVAGDSGGTSETMRIPDTGLIVNCDECQQLARVVSQLLLDHGRREKMGNQAREWVARRFGWKDLASRAGSMFRGQSGTAPLGDLVSANPATRDTSGEQPRI